MDEPWTVRRHVAAGPGIATCGHVIEPGDELHVVELGTGGTWSLCRRCLDELGRHGARIPPPSDSTRRQ